MTPQEQFQFQQAVSNALNDYYARPERWKRPTIHADQIAEGTRIVSITVAGPSGDAAPREFKWRAMGLHLPAAGVAVSVAVGVWFTQPTTSLPAFVLRPGEGVRVPRGFTRVWLQVTGVNLPTSFEQQFILQTDPLNEHDTARRTIVHHLDRVGFEGVVPPAAAPTLATHGTAIESDYTHVTIQFGDDVSPPARITAGESSDHQVWWFHEASGLWCHNEADDFDLAGRGTATNAGGVDHDVEVYSIPRNFSRVYVRRIGATVLHCHLTFSDGA